MLSFIFSTVDLASESGATMVTGTHAGSGGCEQQYQNLVSRSHVKRWLRNTLRLALHQRHFTHKSQDCQKILPAFSG